MQSGIRIQSARRTMTPVSLPDYKPLYFASNRSTITRQKDQEKIEETVVHLKQQMNHVNSENSKLKSVNSQLQKQIQKQEKVLLLNKKLQTQAQTTQQSDYMKAFTDEVFNFQTQSCQLIAHQRQIKILEKQLQEKEQEIEDMKKDSKRTKYLELQTLCQVVQTQYEDLYKKYLAQNHQNQFNNDKDLINRDNILLSTQLMEQTKKIQFQSQKIKQLERDLQQINFSKKVTEKKLEEKDKEIYITQCEYSNPKRTISQINKKWEQKLEFQSLAYNRLEEQLQHKQDEINVLQKQLVNIQEQNNQKDYYQKKEVENLLTIIESLRDQIQKLENQEKLISLPMIETKIEKLEKIQKHNSEKLKKKKIPRVNLQEISQILLELSTKLKLNRVPYIRLDQYIYCKAVKGQLMLQDLIDTFKANPFELQEEQSILISRFIIESEQDEFIYYDINCTNDIIVSLSIFKNIIKQYDLIPYEQFQLIVNQICQIFKINSNKIIGYLSLQNEQCSIQDFKKALEYNEIYLNHNQEDVLLMKVYQQCKQFSKIKYTVILDLFK